MIDDYFLVFKISQGIITKSSICIIGHHAQTRHNAKVDLLLGHRLRLSPNDTPTVTQKGPINITGHIANKTLSQCWFNAESVIETVNQHS